MAPVCRRTHREYLKWSETADPMHQRKPLYSPPNGGATREPKEMKARAMPNCRLRLPSSGYRSAIIAKDRRVQNCFCSIQFMSGRSYLNLMYRRMPSQRLVNFEPGRELHMIGQRRMSLSRGKWHRARYTSECRNQFDQSMHQWMDWLTVEWSLSNRTTFQRPHPRHYRHRP